MSGFSHTLDRSHEARNAMLLDDSVWLQFHQAKTSLFGALLNRRQSPSVHILSAPRSQRDATLTKTNKLISSLLEVEHELKAVQEEVQRVYDSVSRERAAAEMSLRSVGVLPPEVIREIVSHTIIGTHAYRDIFRLSHVSRLWRDVVIGFSALFTEANWDKWPVWLVDTWCSRAGPHLLKVYLGHSRIRSSHADQPLIYALLRKVSMQVGKLQVVTSPFNDELVNNAAEGVFNLHMPSLQYLNVKVVTKTGPILHLQAENVPTLRVLEVTNSIPWVSAPLTNVIGLRYHPASLNTLWPSSDTLRCGWDIFSRLPNLQHLALDIAAVSGIELAKTRRVTLPLLISLEVRWTAKRPIDEVLLFFGAFSLPGLQSLVLHDDFFSCEDYSILLKALVCVRGQEYRTSVLTSEQGQQVPHLRALYSFNDSNYRTWPTVLPVLTPTESTAIIFPDLQEIVFLINSDSSRRCSDEDYNLLRDFVLARRGTLTRLSIPPIWNANILNPLRDLVALEVRFTRIFLSFA